LKFSSVPPPPLAFSLREGVAYEWSAKWRNPGQQWKKSSAYFASGAAATNLSLLFKDAGPEIHVADIKLRRVVANPLDSQIWNYLKNIARLDFGTSTAANLPVLQLLKEGIAPTTMLATPILLIELVVAVSLGLLCAYFRGRFFDRAMVFISVALMSINYLVWIVVGQYLLAYKARLFPVWGFESWTYLALPVLIGVVSGFGGDVRFYRTVMLDEIYKDYVRTAFAKGVSTRDVLFKHVLRNAAVPIVTNVILAIPFLYTGSLLLESYFGIPGVGYLSFNAINSSDPDVIRAVVLIGSVLYVICGLIGDLLAAWFDPRIKLS
jgi:peptide/nickel transport system permease protein